MSKRSAAIGLMAALALVVAACSGTGPAGRPSSRDQVTTTTVAVPTSQAASPQSDRLAVIDVDGNVVTMRPDGTDVVVLAEPVAGGTLRQPIWSPTGSGLAWSEASPEGFFLVIHDGGRTVRVPMAALPFYAMWSPDGARIGAIHNALDGVAGLVFELVDVTSGTSAVAAGGAPYYFSWSPDGAELISHVGASDLAVFGVTDPRLVDNTAGDFQAPAWTPAGIYSIAGGFVVRRVSPDSEPEPIASVTGPTTIVASPTGDRIAVKVFGPNDPGVFAAFQSVPAIPLDTVVVLDPATGGFEVVVGRPSFGYFWSPDGSSLLILVSSSREGELEWWVWRQGEITTRVAVVPTESIVRELLPFFDQYAQSWSPWAPDSSAFAYVAMTDGTEGIWIQELDAFEPRFLTAGSWVAWAAG